MYIVFVEKNGAYEFHKVALVSKETPKTYIVDRKDENFPVWNAVVRKDNVIYETNVLEVAKALEYGFNQIRSRYRAAMKLAEEEMKSELNLILVRARKYEKNS